MLGRAPFRPARFVQGGAADWGAAGVLCRCGRDGAAAAREGGGAVPVQVGGGAAVAVSRGREERRRLGRVRAGRDSSKQRIRFVWAKGK